MSAYDARLAMAKIERLNIELDHAIKRLRKKRLRAERRLNALRRCIERGEAS